MTHDEFIAITDKKILIFNQGKMSFEDAIALAQLKSDEEEFLQINDPSVKDAWEAYKLVLALKRRY